MKIAVDYDDLSPLSHRFDLCEQLRERYPRFKVTFFLIPWDIRFSPSTKGTPITDKQYEPWVEYVANAVKDGWMEIGLHGLTHAPTEFAQLTYDEAKKRIITGQKMCENVGIPLTKLFKAPYWLTSSPAEQAVKDLGLKLVTDGYYNWNLKDPMPANAFIKTNRIKEEEKLLFSKELEVTPFIAHGHLQDGMGCDNGIDESFLRLCEVPPDTRWVFLSEVI